MTLIPDASSEYQEILPVSSDDFIKLLDEWGIVYSRTDHVPLQTVEDSKKYSISFYLQMKVEVIIKISTSETIKNAILL